MRYYIIDFLKLRRNDSHKIYVQKKLTNRKDLIYQSEIPRLLS